jgi:hypothetical protein
MERFSMAQALVSRARTHQNWIGDDHGDRYEDAMHAQAIPDEMQIVVKELLEHLRAALDYCAQQVWINLTGGSALTRIYFPIARGGANPTDFLSLMNRNMPDVAAASATAVAVFRSFQQFADDKNAWLPELATLVNLAKHDHLEVATIPNALLNFSKDAQGRTLMAFQPGHAPKRGYPFMMLKPVSGDLEHGVHQAIFLQLKATQSELSGFIREAIAGVESIIIECEKLR